MKIKVTDNSGQVLSELDWKNARALEKCGLTAEGYAKATAPVDTGRLRNSISHVVDDKTVYIGTNVEYAPYLELGTRKMRAHPYLQPAVENHASQYNQIIKSEFESG